jgi:hypothetical protein
MILWTDDLLESSATAYYLHALRLLHKSTTRTIFMSSFLISDSRISFRGCNSADGLYSFLQIFLRTEQWISSEANCEGSTDNLLLEAILNTDIVFSNGGIFSFFDRDLSKTLLILRPG